MIKLEEIGGHVVSGAIGTVVGGVIGTYADRSVTEIIGIIGGVMLLGSVAATVAKTYQKSAETLHIVAQQHPTIEVHPASSSARTEIYEAARRIVGSAQESIRVLSHNASSHLASAARDAYLDRLEEKVRSKHQAKEVFLYHHIYQLKSQGLEFSKDTVGERAFLHFERLRGLTSNKALSRTKVSFFKVPIVADTALIIVDRRSALIGLLQASSAGMVVSIAIEITDVSGRLIGRLIELFDSIGGDAIL